MAEAEAGNETNRGHMPESYAFTDGSYNSRTKVYGYGGFLVCGGRRYVLKARGDDPEMASSRNVAGEVIGAMAAVKKALEMNLTEMVLYYDYTGIENWALGKWKTNKALTKKYAAFMKQAGERIRLRFVHVKSHSGIPGNEMADRLAKEAVGLIETADPGEMTGQDREEQGSGGQGSEEDCFQALKGHTMERILRRGSRDAAVLLPIIKQEGRDCLLFEVRSRHIRQGGEICFPGGGIAAGETRQQAALRETAEELLVPRTAIEWIAPLFELVGPGGGVVSSGLGRIHGYEGTFQRSEVEKVFVLPIEELLELKPRVAGGRMVLKTDEDYPYELIP
ncbi:MAG: NUDIX domain-containing protein, partial [Lachnospiraceae bacterium]|nr:NUDIX domain-containing protein [Lachnospiraceae bacterium]